MSIMSSIKTNENKLCHTAADNAAAEAVEALAAQCPKKRAAQKLNDSSATAEAAAADTIKIKATPVPFSLSLSLSLFLWISLSFDIYTYIYAHRRHNPKNKKIARQTQMGKTHKDEGGSQNNEVPGSQQQQINCGTHIRISDALCMEIIECSITY